MALEANVPIIPVYTNGIYGKNKRKYTFIAIAGIITH